jgi:hypothetical protein
MTKTTIFKGLTFVIVTLAFTSVVQAQALRTWVSGVGNDADPCSRTAPCKTFAGAIIKTAAGGEIDCLDPGGFGSVTITKSITIDGTHGAGFGSTLASLVNGIIVNDSASGSPNTIVVNLRNLSINGVGNGLNGIRFLSGKSLTVEDCVIHNFPTGSPNGIGIDVNMSNASATDVHIRDTTITNCRIGIRLTQPSGFVSADINRVNIQKMTSDGIQLQTSAFAEIRDTTIQFTLLP